MTMFVNADEDSEVRIKSYLAVMQCPSVDILYKVKQVLATEQVNQVLVTLSFLKLKTIFITLIC